MPLKLRLVQRLETGAEPESQEGLKLHIYFRYSVAWVSRNTARISRRVETRLEGWQFPKALRGTPESQEGLKPEEAVRPLASGCRSLQSRISKRVETTIQAV